ncbi:DEAD/DEAH box helicase [Mangrovibacterium marinum]|uniref:RNA helicase n=1 Tax=Mangrovibacterium marinum TaxID=1639118 RepID=A0A2T5C1I7_9BACT|nr:DEAD/DEAH box helicase [Mangrovibacterium marinum]PTN08517.1 ATP-dependent RNA helicase DeaD [Mangrovibacterium marinum]
MTFEETGLKPELLSAISEMGFQQPTPIQEKTIPHLLQADNDLIALAQTGTGKTAAFGLPLLHNVDLKSKSVQALVLCPTRELCLQISRDLESFSKNLKGSKNIAVYGGTDISKQIRELRSGGQIVVGTPGRVNDLIRRNVLNVGDIRWLVLDEADEMLTMGFKEELDAILANTPSTKQTLLFSATMPAEIAEMSKKYLHNPDELSVGKRNQGSDNVEHHYYLVHAKDKYQTLKRIADNYPDCYAIVFCRTRMETRDVAEKLMADGYNADALHGDLSQAQRDQVMVRFRNKNLQMLVATDVAARGLDVNELTHAINYSLPDDPEVYIHRSGRTGRAGKKGISVSIVNLRETGKIRQIENVSQKRFERKMVPGGEEICEVQLMHLIDRVVQTEVDDKRINPYMQAIKDKFGDLNSDEILKRFVSVEFNRFIEYYRNAPDLNVKEKEPRGRASRGERGGDRVNFSRLFINAGKKQNLNASRLLGMINENLRKKNIEIGKIDIQRKFSFFEIDSRFEADLIKSMNRASIDGYSVKVDRVSGEGPAGFQRSRGRKKDFGNNSFHKKKQR